MQAILGMQPPPAAAVDHVKDVIGTALRGGTAERKLKEKQQRLAYGTQLQKQMQEQAEAKKRERMERMGVYPPAGAGAAPSQQAPASMSPPPQQVPAYAPTAPYQQQPVSAYNPVPAPPPAQFPPAPSAVPPYLSAGYQHSPAPGQLQAPGPAPYQASPPQFASSFQPSYQLPPPPPPPAPIMIPQPMNFGPPSPPSYGASSPPSYGPIMMGSPPGASAWPPQMQGGVRPGPGPAIGGGINMLGAGNTRAAEKAHKDQYRLELEAQIRAKEDRKRAEREMSMQEARARQAMMAAQDYASAVGRMAGGGGAPLRDPQGMMMSDLNAMRDYQHAREQDQMRMMMPPPPGQPSSMMGMGPPAHMMNMGSPQHMMGGMGMGMGPPSPTSVFPGSVPPGMGPPPGMDPLNPNFKFRSDNAYLTAAELDTKARQKAELQEALERQIAEKKYRKDMEKAAAQEEMMREEARLRSEQDRLKAQYDQERNRELGKDTGSNEDKVAAAWARAKAETEEAKRKQYEGRRAAGRHSQEGLQDFRTHHSGDGQVPAASMEPATTYRPQHLLVASPSTPLVAEKVKQMAAQELEKVRAELHAEAASLRNIMAEQTAQVTALKQYADRMEAQAEQAQAKMSQMRVDLIRTSMAAPESLMHMLADYPIERHMPPPPTMLDIALDLPPPAAVQRRTLPPQPAFDMGPLIPHVHNPKEADAQAQRDFMATPGKQQRPPSQGLRTINPLESSLAAESVFIYPNGREMPRHAAPSSNALTAAAHASSDLPFKSLALGPGALSQGASFGNDGFMGSFGNGSPGSTLQQSSVMLSPGRVKAALGGGAGPEGSSHPIIRQEESLNSGPLPPSTADALKKLQNQLQEEAAAAAAAAATAQTPLDVDMLMQQNKDKLSLLQELSALSASESTEAIDAFLTKFSRTRPGLPERTRTPVLRVNTPLKGSTHTSVSAYHSSFPQQSSSVTASHQHHMATGPAPRSPILYTDNMKPALAPRLPEETSRPGSTNKQQASKPGTPLLGQYLDADAVVANNMIPGVALERPPSHGRRAGSTAVDRQGEGVGARPSLGPEDTLDKEMRQGLGSRPPSGQQPGTYTGSRPASGTLAGLPPYPRHSNNSLQRGSRPGSGVQPADGVLSGMPLPGISRQNSLTGQ